MNKGGEEDKSKERKVKKRGFNRHTRVVRRKGACYVTTEVKRRI